MNRLGLSLLVLGAFVGGCTTVSISSHDIELARGGYDSWFSRQGLPEPSGNRIYICHAFGCMMKTPVRLSNSEVAKITAPLRRKSRSPEGERAAVSRSVQRFEQVIGARLGTSSDQGGFERVGGGDPTQMDCIDEAANTTSLLVFLNNHGKLHHHAIGRPVSRGFLLDGRYPHNTAVLEEKATGKRWAVDSWPRANAEPPVIQPLEVWMKERRSSVSDT